VARGRPSAELVVFRRRFSAGKGRPRLGRMGKGTEPERCNWTTAGIKWRRVAAATELHGFHSGGLATRPQGQWFPEQRRLMAGLESAHQVGSPQTRARRVWLESNWGGQVRGQQAKSPCAPTGNFGVRRLDGAFSFPAKASRCPNPKRRSRGCRTALPRTPRVQNGGWKTAEAVALAACVSRVESVGWRR